jgi:hypothetical protein
MMMILMMMMMTKILFAQSAIPNWGTLNAPVKVKT